MVNKILHQIEVLDISSPMWSAISNTGLHVHMPSGMSRSWVDSTIKQEYKTPQGVTCEACGTFTVQSTGEKSDQEHAGWELQVPPPPHRAMKPDSMSKIMPCGAHNTRADRHLPLTQDVGLHQEQHKPVLSTVRSLISSYLSLPASSLSCLVFSS